MDPGDDERPKARCASCGREFPEEELILGVCEECDMVLNDEGSF